MGGKNPQGVEIYANNLYLTRDGILSDDNFFKNGDRIVQAELMNGKDCVVVISEYKHNIYVEVEPQSDHDLHEVQIKEEEQCIESVKKKRML